MAQLLVRNIEEAVKSKLKRRIASLEVEAAGQAANLMATHGIKGLGDSNDAMIAAIAVANRATLATRNTPHFEDLPVPVVNPWLA